MADPIIDGTTPPTAPGTPLLVPAGGNATIQVNAHDPDHGQQANIEFTVTDSTGHVVGRLVLFETSDPITFGFNPATVHPGWTVEPLATPGQWKVQAP